MAKFIQIPGPNGSTVRINIDLVRHYSPSKVRDATRGEVEGTFFYFAPESSYNSSIPIDEVDRLIDEASS